MSSLDALIQGDVNRLMLNTFGLTPISYTPQGGVARPINCIVDEAAVEEVFETATDELDYDILAIWVSATDDTNGIVSPAEMGRPGAGDTLVMAGKTYWVRKINNRAVIAGTGMHLLLISSSRAVLPSFGG